jgi:hypothetical protein
MSREMQPWEASQVWIPTLRREVALRYRRLSIFVLPCQDYAMRGTWTRDFGTVDGEKLGRVAGNVERYGVVGAFGVARIEVCKLRYSVGYLR